MDHIARPITGARWPNGGGNRPLGRVTCQCSPRNFLLGQVLASTALEGDRAEEWFTPLVRLRTTPPSQNAPNARGGGEEARQASGLRGGTWARGAWLVHGVGTRASGPDPEHSAQRAWNA